MKKKIYFHTLTIGMSMLMALTGCSSIGSESAVQQKEEKAKEEKVEEVKKEKTNYEILEEACKKNDEWTTWGVRIVYKVKQPVLIEGEEKLVSTVYDGYSNDICESDICYSVTNWGNGESGSTAVTYNTPEEGYSITLWNSYEPRIGRFYKNGSSSERYAQKRKAVELESAYNEADIFESEIKKENEKTILNFCLKDSQKYQNLLKQDNSSEDSNASEDYKYLYTKFDATYVIGKEGYVESYSYDIVEKTAEDQENSVKIENTFYRPNDIVGDRAAIDALIQQIPKDQSEGQFTSDFKYTVELPKE